MTKRHRAGFMFIFIALATLLLLLGSTTLAAEGRVMIPVLTGHPETRVFSGHPGWVDLFDKGYGQGVWARIGQDGTFTLPDPVKPGALIVMFDKIETPPFVVPHWPVEQGKFDVTIPVEYACVPVGYPDVKEGFTAARGHSLYQEFVPACTELYGVSFFDGPKIAEWGSQLSIMLHADKPKRVPIAMPGQLSPDPGWQGKLDRLSTNKGEHEMLRMGWRHGNMPVEPGRKYVVQVEGYRSHSGKNYKLNGYLRPDTGDGYPLGQAMIDEQPADGDLCCLIFGNSHGQLVENHIRSEEWEIFLPHHRPATDWGQAFVANGVSMAGLSFWASIGDADSALCEVRIREEGPWGQMLKPAKVARGHESPDRPFVRYPDTPQALKGYEAFYKLPSRLFQVAYLPDEIKLTPGKTYYIEVIPSKPLMMYADGEAYQEGYAYYEGLKVDRQTGGQDTKHSARWTLAMNIVTYARPGGKPLAEKK